MREGERKLVGKRRKEKRKTESKGWCLRIISYLLWRWSVKVMVVQTDRGVEEQKDTVQVRGVTLASWF